MTKPKRPQYENVQYKPPTPQVFGNAMPDDLPTFAPKQSSFSVDRPRNRPKLADRLAVYEDDNPRCQQILCIGGFVVFPLFFVGAAMYFRTPTTKVLTREAGFKNVVMSCVAAIICVCVGLYHLHSYSVVREGV